jgi:hypothetical protein
MKKIVEFFILFFALVFAGCSSSTNGLQEILGVSAEAPVFLDCRPVSSTEMVFSFTTGVRVISLNFDSDLEIASIAEGSEVIVSFSNPLAEGKKVTADILVEDSGGNSLNVIVPFRAKNDRMPALVFNEIRTEYSKPKVEFLEFFAPGPGNLGAIRLFIAGHSLSKPIYEFSPTEVEAGEYIVLHLRTIEEGCVDETGQNLALSSGTEALNDVRDFWLPGSAKAIRKTDALWLMDQDDRIIDAVLLSEKADTGWNGKNMAEAAELLGQKRAWLPASGDRKENWIPAPSDAVISAGTTATRTICRDESLASKPQAGNWYITATSSASPGKPNNPKRYAP